MVKRTATAAKRTSMRTVELANDHFCETCRARLMRTSRDWFACPNGHGKLVPASSFTTVEARHPEGLYALRKTVFRILDKMDEHKEANEITRAKTTTIRGMMEKVFPDPPAKSNSVPDS